MLKELTIEQIFLQEVREKKRTGNGIHSRTGTRGYVGKMRMPSEIMSRKDKYNYRKAGKVVTTIVKEEILTRDEFLKLSIEEQKATLTRYRNKYSTADIQKGMGIGNKPYYKIVKELNLPVAPRGRGATSAKKKNVTKKPTVKNTPVQEIVQAQPPTISIQPIQQVQQAFTLDGLAIQLKGSGTSDLIVKKLDKLRLLLEDEKSEFEFEIRIFEKI